MSFFLSAVSRRVACRPSVMARRARPVSTQNNIETTGISLDMIHSDNSSKMRNTKIVCTIGPACWSHGKYISLSVSPPGL